MDDEDPNAEALRAWLAERGSGDDVTREAIRIAPDEVDAVALFYALGTQWRRQLVVSLAGAASILQGLDYGVVETTARLSGVAMTPALFRDLQLMEREAIKEAAR